MVYFTQESKWNFNECTNIICIEWCRFGVAYKMNRLKQHFVVIIPIHMPNKYILQQTTYEFCDPTVNKTLFYGSTNRVSIPFRKSFVDNDFDVVQTKNQ